MAARERDSLSGRREATREAQTPRGRSRQPRRRRFACVRGCASHSGPPQSHTVSRGKRATSAVGGSPLRVVRQPPRHRVPVGRRDRLQGRMYKPLGSRTVPSFLFSLAAGNGKSLRKNRWTCCRTTSMIVYIPVDQTERKDIPATLERGTPCGQTNVSIPCTTK